MHAFDLPSSVHEVCRKPVQQPGVRRLVALSAEIIRGPDNTPSKKLLPHPVDCHPGGERIVSRDHPSRKREPGRRWIAWHGVQERRRGGLDLNAMGSILSAN